MSDLRTLMFEAANSTPTTTAPQMADQDLARARRALRRRHAGRIGASSGLVAIVALGAIAIAAPGVFPGARSAPPATAKGTTESSTGSAGSVGGTALVAYTGKQPSGYTLDKVPEGWKIYADNPGVLTLAPVGFKETEPDGMESFIGKIAVMQEGKESFPSGIPMDKVRVGGKPGVVAHMKGGGDTRTLFVQQPSGDYLAIQVWSGLGWGNDRIVEFAAGVHITKDAEVGHG